MSMYIPGNFTSAAIHKIDTEDREFIFAFQTDISAIKKSIEAVGLLLPVLLRKRPAEDSYQIISGFKRVLACIELKMTSIDACVFEEDEIDPLKGFLMNLHENISVRSLNLVEKSICLSKLTYRFKVDRCEIITGYLPLLNIQPNDNMLVKHLKLIELEDAVKKYIVDRDIPLVNALKFLDFSRADRITLISFLASLKIGTNHLRQILTNIEDICIRDRITVKEVLDNPSIRNIMSNDRLSGPVKVKMIVSTIERDRYPKFTDIKQKINEGLNGLDMLHGMKITYPPSLEGEKWKIEAQFKDSKELKNIGEKIVSIAEKDEIKDIIETLWET